MVDIQPVLPDEPTNIGRYQVLGRLAVGSKGLVYLAQTVEGRKVVVRLLNPAWMVATGGRAGLSEALVAAQRIGDLATSAVLEADLDGDVPYVVSEYVPGPTLQEVVNQNGPMNATALRHLAVATLKALVAIHDEGLVHCDVTPSNIIIGPDGPRLIDLGLAQDAVPPSFPPGSPRAQPYVSPELWPGRPAGQVSDLFAWASTMTFAATGWAPFTTDPAVDGDANDHLLTQLCTMDSQGTLTSVLRECLNPDPDQRPTARQVLRRLLENSPDRTGAIDLAARSAPSVPLARQRIAVEWQAAVPAPALALADTVVPAPVLTPNPPLIQVDLPPYQDPTPAWWTSSSAAGPSTMPTQPLPQHPQHPQLRDEPAEDRSDQSQPRSGRLRFAGLGLAALLAAGGGAYVAGSVFKVNWTPGAGQALAMPAEGTIRLSVPAPTVARVPKQRPITPPSPTQAQDQTQDPTTMDPTAQDPTAQDPAMDPAQNQDLAQGPSMADPQQRPIGASGCRATYQVVEQWPGGFKGEITVMAGKSPVTGWRLHWTFPGDQQVTQWWNAALTSRAAHVFARNALTNHPIKAGESFSFVFLGTYHNTNPVPTVTCTTR